MPLYAEKPPTVEAMQVPMMGYCGTSKQWRELADFAAGFGYRVRLDIATGQAYLSNGGVPCPALRAGDYVIAGPDGMTLKIAPRSEFQRRYAPVEGNA